MNINVIGVWCCVKVVVDLMKEVGGGSIVNIVLLVVVYGFVNGVYYVMSKVVVIGLSCIFVWELGCYWICVNVVVFFVVMMEGIFEFMGDCLEKVKEVIVVG